MSAVRLGKPLVHPVVDVLLIAGGLSFVVLALIPLGLPQHALGASSLWFVLVLCANLAHFASSTVRLYTKRGASTERPFVGLALPLVTLAVLVFALVFADRAGWHLICLYLTWSAYHYAAQTYGISMIYAYRSGTAPTDGDRLVLRAACLLPFLYLFVRGPSAGVEWFVPMSVLAAPNIAPVRANLVTVLQVAALAAPLLAFLYSLRQGRPLPLVSVLAMAANAIWWTLPVFSGSAWVPLFHGLQYIPIVTAFHVRERLRDPGNTRGAFYHTLTFYAACVGLAYLLFGTWPYAFIALGFGHPESVLLVIAIINIHHFIVDAYIWRIRRDPNYRVVTDGAAPPITAQPAVA